jgi:prolipoprotein diacylglyceryltransferase
VDYEALQIMRPLFVAWLEKYGIPAIIVPDYFMMSALSMVFCTTWMLRYARRDGINLRSEALSLALIYLAVLSGGYIFEAIRAVPSAIFSKSLEPFAYIGRAAWGGVIGGALVALWLLRIRGQSAARFFDLISVPTSMAFVLVRIGCFLAGCDYGRPTDLWLGIRFPPNSLAALDHANRGLVMLGSPSLPVHPTQLYESTLSLIAAMLAWMVLRKKRYDGSAFFTWLAAYSISRFAIEWLRGDTNRGIYGPFSSAQYISLFALTISAIFFITKLHKHTAQEVI